MRLSQLINAIRTELAVQEGNKLGKHTVSFDYKLPFSFIAA